LLNVLSQDVDVTVSASGHSEVWNLLTSGNNPYNGQPNTNFILRDWDRGGEDISYPNGHNDRNNPTDAGTVYPGLYTQAIRDIFFNPAMELPGKTYVGTADHLFQLCLDPNHEHYGYYYYNSELNAASDNRSDGRFYVYEYLERTRDSSNSEDGGKYSDFLPFNSPYANTAGKTVHTYNYNGVEGEYQGTTHYMYEAKDDNNSPVGTNYLFGMSIDVDFYLPNKPGTGGNKDLYGNDMQFHFSGDDDLWVLIDGVVALDIGGIHQIVEGSINFSTGQVLVNGKATKSLMDLGITAGDHTLTIL
jgi:fibro-slime domain-containing protein